MNIQPINFNQQKTPSFKSAFPVVHWVAESNGSYARVRDLGCIKELQGEVLKMLNPKNSNPIAERVRNYFRHCDKDYRWLQKVRSFYDKSRLAQITDEPISYMITGEDALLFSERFGRAIGTAKRESLDYYGTTKSPETNTALYNYNKHGLEFVKSYSKQIRDKNNQEYVLYTKFEVVRDVVGQAKGYRFVDMLFMPKRED